MCVVQTPLVGFKRKGAAARLEGHFIFQIHSLLRDLWSSLRSVLEKQLRQVSLFQLRGALAFTKIFNFGG